MPTIYGNQYAIEMLNNIKQNIFQKLKPEVGSNKVEPSKENLHAVTKNVTFPLGAVGEGAATELAGEALLLDRGDGPTATRGDGHL